MVNKQLVIAKDIDAEKVSRDLNFLAQCIKFTQQRKWRLVVYGGYGLDGYLKTITRSHGDLDIVIYGQSNRKVAENLLKSYLESQLRNVQIIVKQEPFFLELDVRGTNFAGNLYYVETAQDPQQDLTQVRKVDGEIVINSTKDFPTPVEGKLQNLEVEVQDQSAHLADILRRRETDYVAGKHDQDIENIKTVIMNRYQKEAKTRWGHTAAFKQSTERVKKMGKAGLQKVMAEGRQIETDLAQVMSKPATDPMVQSIVTRHRAQINHFYDVSDQIYRGLADLYLTDGRFFKHYEDIAPGLAQFVHDAIMASLG